MNITALYDALVAVCPIDGVSVGDPANKATWRIDYHPTATSAQQSAAQSTLQSYVVPPDSTILGWEDFMALFTPTEQGVIVTSTDTQLRIWLLKASGAGEINFGDPRTKQGLDYLVSLGIINSTRESQILSNTPPA